MSGVVRQFFVGSDGTGFLFVFFFFFFFSWLGR